jgi:hypothetical protein
VQWGLGSYERYLAGDGEVWLAAALHLADRLVAEQCTSGERRGAWLHHAPYHTFELTPPWLSGMAQGEGASLLLRLHRETGREELAAAALRALEPLSVPTERGGALARLGTAGLPEEYPTAPPSYVLNGLIFALWGWYDAAVALDDEGSRRAFEQALDGLAANLHRWDNGYWSRYDLYPHPVPNVASPAYHELHLQQLDALERIAPRADIAAVRHRWEAYAASPVARTRALLAKVLFRLRVPRRSSG